MPTLIFVYNADGGPLNALRDMVHKIISPATYPCSLCALTYGPFAMRRGWRNFLDSLGCAKLFLYRDEMRDLPHIDDLALPVILLARGPGQPEVLVDADELSGLDDCDALIAFVEHRLEVVCFA
ncbi:hypothetical protein [Porphyrobacter sp. AAP60]|uniref:hypothetical protein n=1 Tax=Porphyrobacter sp. AAP60 TaxID=1523423 RepID=UPI0006B8D136|nr:hypothetical protein [Porphyrobacter sp. AAP60]KPF63155.1 hypothetical protein IP79_11255 [Porphyrobacter sp. AAP60]